MIDVVSRSRWSIFALLITSTSWLIAVLTSATSQLNLDVKIFGEAANSTAPNSPASSQETPKRNLEGESTAALHFLWGRPLPTDRGYAGKVRVLDNTSFTGCCDVMIELALRSYIALAANGTRLCLWNMGGWDAEGFLRHIGLDGAILAVPFDPDVELAGEAELQEVYSALSRVVPRSDFVRYVIMRNHGGSYIDLDGILVRPIPADGVPRINISPTKANLNRTGAVVHQNCEGAAYTPRAPGTCILSNGMFVNFPRRHPVFVTLLDAIRSKKRTCGGGYFFCYGPSWLSTTLRTWGGISNVADVGVQPQALLRNAGIYRSQHTVLVQHFDFDDGDIKCSDRRVSNHCKQFGMSLE